MAILSLSQISISFGSKILLDKVSLQAEKGEKIGFIGRNGTGKSTLLKILSKKLIPDHGQFNFEENTVCGYLEQELDSSVQTSVLETALMVRGDVLQMEKKMDDLRKEMASPRFSQDLEYQNIISDKYHKLETRFEQEEGYRLVPLAKSILFGLGFSEEQLERNVQEFSGGEKNLILLSRILLSEPDIILLDEPANHMDFDRIEWLEGYLSRCRSTVILVSHNRFLLDRCVDKIWELENGKINEYTGNYTEYRTEKTLRLQQQQALYEKTQKKIQSLLFTAQRLASWGMVYDNPKLAKKAQIIRKRVEKMESSVPPPDKEGKSIGLRFFNYIPRSKLALEINNYSFAFPGCENLLENINLFISSGERIALLGRNGSGKTTLFQSIWEHGSWENPVIRIGKNIEMAYYSQMHTFLEPEKTVFDNLNTVCYLTHSEATKLLHSLLFTQDDLHRPVRTLSGGEKGRLQLAKILVKKPNFLMMDEPTNHLDIPSREVMEEALADYKGTLLVISHDQYFLDKMVDRLCFLQNGQLTEFDGNYSDFYDYVHENRLQKKNQKEEFKKEQKKLNRKENLKIQRDLREYNKIKKQLDNEILSHELSIQNTETQLETLELEMAEVYENGNFERGNQISTEIAHLRENVKNYYHLWEESEKKLSEYIENTPKP